MKVREIQQIMESWAPPDIAWEDDNVGLQCGSPEMSVRGIAVALDATEGVIAEARRKRANLVITHHPLLFRPLRSISPSQAAGRCIAALVQNKITLYSAHTNLDFTSGGTSFALAESLGLVDVEFLYQPYKNDKKIVTFVPESHADSMIDAMSAAGAGRIGNYERCSFQSAGTGSFLGRKGAHPVVGKRGALEEVTEHRVEMIVPARSVNTVVRALRMAHPYEEVAYDIYPLENKSARYGMGVIGTLAHPLRLAAFLSLVKRTLGARVLRWTGDPRRVIRRVAACGGSGAKLTPEAMRQNADAYVTADMKYHDFQEPESGMALIDAGHFETEYPVVGAVVRTLKKELRSREERIPVFATAATTNPVFYV